MIVGGVHAVDDELPARWVSHDGVVITWAIGLATFRCDRGGRVKQKVITGAVESWIVFGEKAFSIEANVSERWTRVGLHGIKIGREAGIGNIL